MAIFVDAQTDAADLAKLVNEDTEVTTRYGDNPKRSWKFLEGEFDTLLAGFSVQGDAAIDAINADVVTVDNARIAAQSAINSDVVVVDNAKDSALTSINSNKVIVQQAADSVDVLVDKLTENYNLTPAFDFVDGFTIQTRNQAGKDANGKYWIYNGTLPFEVTAGTVPSEPDYKQVVFSDHANLANRNAIGAHDEIYARSVNCIKDLENYTDLVEGQKFNVTGFYDGATIGGGEFVYQQSKPRADHNGGTIISPAAIAAWNGTQSDIATLLDWTGVGNGCFVRDNGKTEILSVECFGAVPSVTIDNRAAITSCILNGGTIVAKSEYLIEGIERIPVGSNTFIDMCNTGAFVRTAKVPAANFYDYSFLHFENSSNSGLLRCRFKGINSGTANSDDTTGVSVSVGAGCDKLYFDDLEFIEGWTGLLLGTNLTAVNASKNIFIGKVYASDAEQAIVASAVKGLHIQSVTAERLSSKFAQRGLFLQNVQDVHVGVVRTKNISATSFYVKAYKGIFPAANIVVESIISENSTGQVNAACAISTTVGVDNNNGNVIKNLTVGTVSTEYSGAAVQIIAENQDQLENISIKEVNGSVRDAALDIRLNGNRVKNIDIGNILVDLASSDYGIIVQGGATAYTRRIEDNITIQSFKYTDRGEFTQDLVLQNVEGVTVYNINCISDIDDGTGKHKAPVVRTTNTNNCNISLSDTSDLVSVDDYLLKVNDVIDGAAFTIYVDDALGDDGNNGTINYPVKSISVALNMLTYTVLSDFTLEVANAVLVNPILIENIRFGGVTNFNFNESQVPYITFYNVDARTTRAKINDVITTSSSVSNVRFENTRGVTLDNLSCTGAGVIGVDTKGSEVIVSNSYFGTSTVVCIAADYGGTVVSVNNTGNATSTGLRARFGSVIAKSGTQPTGTSTNESEATGGQVR